MKKLILILCLCLALALCFVACDGKTDAGDVEETLTIEISTTNAPMTEELTTEHGQQTEETISEDFMLGGEKFVELSTGDEKERELRAELVRILELKDGFVTPIIGSFEEKMDWILFQGRKLTHVQFDSTKYYYVCGYYNCEHADESKWYNCASKYTWIIVDNESDILEYYNGFKFIAAFQINKTVSAIDIATGEAVSTEVEHYLEYTPEFVNGKNVSEKIYLDATYICFTDPADKYMLDCSEDNYHYTYTLSCVELEGEWYLKFYDNGIENNFGEYNDLLISISKKYTTVNKLGNTVTYIIVEFSDFANAFLNNYR